MNNICTFCEIFKNRDGIIFENDFFYAQFDKFPVAPGHAEVIPKMHTVSLFDLSAEAWQALFPALEQMIAIIETTDLQNVYEQFLKNPIHEKSERFCNKMLSHDGLGKKPDGYNIGNNEGKAAGRTIHHLHIHIIPRYIGDVSDPVGGIRHIIPGMGNYK